RSAWSRRSHRRRADRRAAQGLAVGGRPRTAARDSGRAGRDLGAGPGLPGAPPRLTPTTAFGRPSAGASGTASVELVVLVADDLVDPVDEQLFVGDAERLLGQRGLVALGQRLNPDGAT